MDGHARKLRLDAPSPCAIHSHNNASSSEPLPELIFSAAEPLSGADRTIYDVEGCRCWGSAFNVNSIMGGDRYPVIAPSGRGCRPHGCRFVSDPRPQWGFARR